MSIVPPPPRLPNQNEDPWFSPRNEWDEWAQDAIDVLSRSTAIVGEIKMVALQGVPVGYLRCNGQAVARADFPDLFAAIGTSFGAGDGNTTFNVPNLNNRVPRGAQSGSIGQVGGADSVTLSQAQMPEHSHTMTHTHAAATAASNGNHTHLGRQAPRSGSGSGQLLRPASSTDSDGGSTTVTASGGAHTHNVPIPQFSGFTANSGSGNPVDITPAHQLVGFIIKT